jgi:hypothetical protein
MKAPGPHAFGHATGNPTGSLLLLAPSNASRQPDKIKNHQKHEENPARLENPALQTHLPCQKNAPCHSTASAKGKRTKYFPR